jgi:hypothetical protein
MGAISFKSSLDKGAERPNKNAAASARSTGFAIFGLIFSPKYYRFTPQ